MHVTQIKRNFEILDTVLCQVTEKCDETLVDDNKYPYNKKSSHIKLFLSFYWTFPDMQYHFTTAVLKENRAQYLVTFIISIFPLAIRPCSFTGAVGVFPCLVFSPTLPNKYQYMSGFAKFM